MTILGRFFISIFVKRPVNLDYMIFPLILALIFLILRQRKHSPFNS